MKKKTQRCCGVGSIIIGSVLVISVICYALYDMRCLYDERKASGIPPMWSDATVHEYRSFIKASGRTDIGPREWNGLSDAERVAVIVRGPLSTDREEQ